MKAEEERVEAKVQLKDLILERDQLRGKVQEQSGKVDQLSQAIQECKTTERLLEQRAKQLEVGEKLKKKFKERSDARMNLRRA